MTCPHMVELNTAIVWFASLQIRDWLHSVPDQRHFRQRVHRTMCVLSISLKLEYLSFSAEWLENTSLLRGTGSRPPSHCTEVSPLLCIIDTTATGCSEMLKFCYIAPHPRHTHSRSLLMPSANLRENHVILLEIILCFHCHLKSFGGWAGHPGNSMTLKDPENYFSSLTAQKKTPEQPVWISVLSFIWHLWLCVSVNGYIINANRMLP